MQQLTIKTYSVPITVWGPVGTAENKTECTLEGDSDNNKQEKYTVVRNAMR